MMFAGADSLAHDRLGCFNLSMKGHGEAVAFMKQFNVPMLVTGGGGYTKHNVARCWTYETALLVDAKIDNELPETDYHEYFGPDYCLNVAAHKVMEDCNTKQVSTVLYMHCALCCTVPQVAQCEFLLHAACMGYVHTAKHIYPVSMLLKPLAQTGLVSVECCPNSTTARCLIAP